MSREWWLRHRQINPPGNSRLQPNYLPYQPGIRMGSPQPFLYESSINGRYSSNNQSLQWQWNKKQHGRSPKKVNQADSLLAPCSRCRRFFDVYGRAPIILDCEHCFCEECIVGALDNFEVKCFICGEISQGKVAIGDFQSVKEAFQINYYLVGKLVCERTRHQAPVLPALKLPNKNMDSFSGEMNTCSIGKCTNEAIIRCLNCFEVYCTECSDKVHTAKGLRNHQLEKFERLTIIPCDKHCGYLMEILCTTCDVLCCPKCFIRDHPKHDMHEAATLTEEDRPSFEQLLAQCEQKYELLMNSCRKSRQLLTKSIANPGPSSVETTKKINQCFVDLHSQLQVIEKNLLARVKLSASHRGENSGSISQEIDYNLTILRELIVSGRNLLKPSDDAKFNVMVLVNQMEYAVKLPTCLVSEDDGSEVKMDFRCGIGLKDLHKEFTLNITNTNKLKLLTEEEASKEGIDITFELTETPDTSSAASSEMNFNMIMSPMNVYEKVDYYESVREKCKFENMPIRKCLNEAYTEYELGKKEKIQVTQVNNPDSILVQLTKNTTALENLHRQLLNLVQKEEELSLDRVEIDTLYVIKACTKIHYDFMRCTIIDIEENEDNDTLYKIKYVDFGVLDEVKSTDLCVWELSPELADVLPMVYNCKLINISPNNTAKEWDNKSIGIVSEMLKQNAYIIVYKDPTVINLKLEVDFVVICDDDIYSLRDCLIFLGCGVSDNDNLPNNSTVAKKLDLPYIDINARSMPEYVDVIILNVINPSNFYVQQVNSLKALKDLNEKMNLYYENNRYHHAVYAPYINQAIAVKYEDIHSDQKLWTWQRAYVTEVRQGSGLIKAFFVDVGITAVLEWTKIRRLNEQFIYLNCQALNVQLADIKCADNEWSDNAIEYFQNLTVPCSNFSMKIREYGSPLSAVLFHSSVASNVNVNAALVDLKYAVPISKEDEYRSQVEMQNLRSSLQVNESVNIKGPLKRVKILEIINPGLLYLHLIDDEILMTELDIVQRTLQEYATKRKLISKHYWNEGEPCVAYDTNKKQFYRCIIESMIENTVYQVLSRDYGFSFYAHSKDIGLLEDVFKASPTFAYRAHFHGLEPTTEGWSPQSVEFLKNIMMGSSNIYMSNVGDEETIKLKRSASVIFWEKNLKLESALISQVWWLNINNLLVEKGFAYMVEDDARPIINIFEDADEDLINWLPPKPIFETEFVAAVSYIDNEGCIYYHLERECNALQKLTDDIQDQIKEEEPQSLLSWKQGYACIALYDVDELWYRGLVTEVNDSYVQVFMVDFGNTETCPLENVKKTEMFSDIPPFARKAKLNLEKKLTKNIHQIVNILYELLVEETVTIKVLRCKSQIPIVSVFNNLGNILDQLSPHSQSISDPQPISNPESISHSQPISHPQSISCPQPIFNPLSISHPKIEKRSDSCWKFNYLPLPKENMFRVKIAEILAYNMIAFELEASYVNNDIRRATLRRVNCEINDEESSLYTSNIIHRPGFTCVAKYSEDGSYYRAQIESKNPENNLIKVLFVDYGHSEFALPENIKPIKRKWLELSVNMFTAKLHDFNLTSDQDKEQASNYLKRHYLGQVKMCEVVSKDPSVVNLYDIGTHKVSYKTLFNL